MKAKILEGLSNDERKTFQDIVGPKNELNRNTVRKKLDELLEEGLIKEVNKKEWRKGKKLWFRITAEGEKRVLNESVADVAGSLKRVRDLTARIARQDPEKLLEFRQYLRQPAEEDARTLDDGTLTPEEWVERTVQRVEQRSKDDPLRESLKAIYDIFLQVNLVERIKGGWAMTILEDGFVHLIPNARWRKQLPKKSPRKGG